MDFSLLDLTLWCRGPSTHGCSSVYIEPVPSRWPAAIWCSTAYVALWFCSRGWQKSFCAKSLCFPCLNIVVACLSSCSFDESQESYGKHRVRSLVCQRWGLGTPDFRWSGLWSVLLRTKDKQKGHLWSLLLLLENFLQQTSSRVLFSWPTRLLQKTDPNGSGRAGVCCRSALEGWNVAFLEALWALSLLSSFCF